MSKSKTPVFVNLQDGNVQVPRQDGRMITVAPWSQRRHPQLNAVYEVEGDHFAHFVSAQGPLYPKPVEDPATFRPPNPPTLQRMGTLRRPGTLQPVGTAPTLAPLPEDDEVEPADASATPPAASDDATASDAAPSDAPADPVAAAYDGADDDADATADEDGLSSDEAKPAPGQEVQVDDFTAIPKIGPELDGALKAIGILTFKTLADADVEKLESVPGISASGAKTLKREAAKRAKKSLKDRARG